MNRPEAEAIAEAVSAIRPKWLKTSLLTLLADFQAKSARDVMLALVWVAYDPETKTPGRIREQGDWWNISRAASTTTPPAPYFEPYTRGPAEPHATPDTIRAIRAQISEEGESE